MSKRKRLDLVIFMMRYNIAGHEFVFSESSEVFGLPASVRKISGVVEKLSNLPKVLSFEKKTFGFRSEFLRRR